jgi:hypothetical protein
MENTTEEDIHVEDFVTSCGCLGIEPRSFSVPAYARRTLQMRLDLTGRLAGQEGLAVRDYAVSFVPRTRDGHVLQGWILRGSVRSAVTLSPSSIHFGDRLVRGQSFLGERLRGTLHVPLKSIEEDHNPREARIKILTDANDQEHFDLDIQPDRDLPAGPFRILVKLHFTAADGEAIPPITVPVTGTVMQDVQAVPAIVQLGVKRVGTPLSETIILRSVSAKPFKVLGLDKPMEGVNIEPLATNQSHASQSYRVTLLSPEPGHRSLSLRFLVEENAQPPFSVPLTITYYGWNDGPPPIAIGNSAARTERSLLPSEAKAHDK